jgi:hypothetical protein
MAYKDVLKNGIRTYEDLEKWLTAQKARVDPRAQGCDRQISDARQHVLPRSH